MPNATAKGIGFLALIALGCGALLATTDRLTAQRIASNKHAHELKQTAELIGMPPATEPRWQAGVWQLCNGIDLIKAQTTGYGGPIVALVARRDGKLHGLRVTAHQETPGIADFVARPNDPWRKRLRQHTSRDLATFDTVSGATITSKALLGLVQDALAQDLAPGQCDP